MTRAARIELARADAPRTRSGQPHYLRLRASNGEILAHSEMYSSRSNARRAIAGWRRAMAQAAARPAKEA